MNHTQTVQAGQKAESYLLRYALWANVLFSGISGLLSLLAADQLATLMGISETAVFTVLGIGLLAFALTIAWFASRPTIDQRFAWIVIIMDVVWVIDSIAILIVGWPPLTTAGKWIVAIVADIVAIIAIAQFIGLRRLSK